VRQIQQRLPFQSVRTHLVRKLRCHELTLRAPSVSDDDLCHTRANFGDVTSGT
jgi:hypothetical protein